MIPNNWRTTEKVPSSLALPDMFLDRIGSGARILDVGCGEAGIAPQIEAAGGRYFGLDVNLPSLSRLSGRRRVVLGEGGRLSFKNGTFDLVMLRAVLTVLVDPSDRLNTLREAFRVCRGMVGIQDFLQTWDAPLYAARYEEGLSLSAERGTFPVRQDGRLLYWARHYTPEELNRLIASAGGRIVSLHEAPAPTRSGNIIRGVTLVAVRR